MWLRAALLLSAVALAQPACQAGWTFWGNYCYWLSKDKVFWSEASNACRTLSSSANLVSIHSSGENTFVQGFISGYQYVWIGLNDKVTENIFQWSDGTAVNYSNWMTGQPDDLNDSDCVFFKANGQWDDGVCEDRWFDDTPPKNYVCKMLA